jgi:hypothetical protein
MREVMAACDSVNLPEMAKTSPANASVSANAPPFSCTGLLIVRLRFVSLLLPLLLLLLNCLPSFSSTFCVVLNVRERDGEMVGAPAQVAIRLVVKEEKEGCR